MKKEFHLTNDIVYFGIDFGIKKIGIAIAQSITKKASPLKIIYNKNNITNWEELDKIIQNWLPKIIVVGQPHTKIENDFIKSLNCFNKELKEKYANDLEIINYSEVLSTEESKSIYREMRKKDEKVKKRFDFDDLSASLILQSWLNENMIN